MKKISCSIIMISILFLFAAVACTTKVMWSGTNVPGHFSAGYKTFSGNEGSKFKAEAGSVLEVSYESEVTAGDLEITLLGPDNDTVLTLPSGKKGAESLELEKSGTYTFKVEGASTSGSFDIRWAQNYK